MSLKSNANLAERRSYSHWSPEHVRWSDTDLVGHANNLTFGAFAETGRCLFLQKFLKPHADQAAMFMPATIVINLLSEVFWPAQVDVGTGILELGNTSFRFGQGMFEGERCFCTSESVFVFVDLQSRRPAPIPDGVRYWLQQHTIAP